MRHTPLLLASLVVLAGCSGGTAGALLENPLYAEYYFNDFAERMANIEIQKDDPLNKAILDDERLLSALREAKDDALAKGSAAKKMRDKGGVGTLVPVAEFPAGNVMVLGSMLYTDPAFSVPPGPDLHFVLTTMVDPREGEFPDPESASVGIVQNYGASAYAVPAPPEGKQWRSVAVYDKTLRRLYAFAQLNYGPAAR